MPVLLTIGFGFGILLGAIHYWNEKLFFSSSHIRSRFVSFVAGASAAYLFLNLMPHVYEGVTRLDRWVFLFILFGFTLVHVLEKYFYQHARGKELHFQNKELHFAVFFVYYIIIGITFFDLVAERGIGEGILFALPVLFYAAISRLSFGEIHGHLRAKRIFRTLISFATLIGIVVAWLVTVPEILQLIMLSFIIGSLLHIMMVDFVPKEAAGRPLYFVVGAVLYSLGIVAVWLMTPAL